MDLAWALSAVALGIRHGFDWDHILAIGDLTASATSKWDALRTSSLYALGHASVVLILGAVVVIFGITVSPAVDGVMTKLAGLTLVVLALYVFYGLARGDTPRSMQARAVEALLKKGRKLRTPDAPAYEMIEHDHPHVHDRAHSHGHGVLPAPTSEPGRRLATSLVAASHTHNHVHMVVRPRDPFAPSGAAFGIGAVHGVGAETPTQLSLLASVAGVGGAGAGVGLVFLFVAGMLLSNSVLVALFTRGAESAGRMKTAIAIVAASLSAWLGIALLVGDSPA